MTYNPLGLTNPTDANLRSENEEIIRRLDENFPSPNRPYRHGSRMDESRGEIVYAMSAI